MEVRGISRYARNDTRIRDKAHGRVKVTLGTSTSMMCLPHPEKKRLKTKFGPFKSRQLKRIEGWNSILERDLHHHIRDLIAQGLNLRLDHPNEIRIRHDPAFRLITMLQLHAFLLYRP